MVNFITYLENNGISLLVFLVSVAAFYTRMVKRFTLVDVELKDTQDKFTELESQLNLLKVTEIKELREKQINQEVLFARIDTKQEMMLGMLKDISQKIK